MLNESKLNSSGEVEKYKARVVVKGYKQKYGIECDESFAPMRNNSFVVGSICSKRMEGASNECEICILEWGLARRSVCWAASMWRIEKKTKCKNKTGGFCSSTNHLSKHYFHHHEILLTTSTSWRHSWAKLFNWFYLFIYFLCCCVISGKVVESVALFLYSLCNKVFLIISTYIKNCFKICIYI